MEKNEIRILFVEDNPGDVRLVSEMLMESGVHFFKMARAARIDEALKTLSGGNIDAVLLDFNLPDAIEFSGLERISRQEPEIPVVVLTGVDDADFGIEALQKGAQDYLIKGAINTDVLVRTVRYAIERKEAEKALRQSEGNYRSIVETTREGIWVFDPEGRITFANGRIIQMLGYAGEEMIGRPGWEFAADESEMTASRQRFQDYKKGVVRQYEVPLRRKDGGVLWMLANAAPIFDAEGRHTGNLCMYSDITERKRAEEILKRDKETFERLVKERSQELMDAQIELERAKRLSDMGTLAATIAHELRNPLAAIGMAASNIKRKAQNPALDKHLDTIEKKVLDSDRIINNLLFYSRIKSANLENVNIHDILEECFDLARKQSKKDISFKKDIHSIKDTPIEADPLQIREVFHNILNNAYDAVSNSKGEIEIGGGLDGGNVRIGVKDNGSGIKKDILGKVFDPFFTTKSKGTGLGLTVCRQIISLNGGTMHIESEEGKGTTVTVTLPRNKKHLA